MSLMLFRTTITINVIATFLLVRLLLPKLQSNASQGLPTARVTILASVLHKFATLSARKSDKIFEALKQAPKDYPGRYNDSKLLVLLYGQKLAATVGKSVSLTMVCPGWCASNLHRPATMGERAAERAMARSVDEGARVIVDAVAADKAKERNGAFVSDCKVKR